ncbi:MAG: magnesium transporter MgtE N-terminal domain-containing protein [Thiogranum sp.]
MNPHFRLSVAALKSQPAMAARVLENFTPDAVSRLLAATSPETTGQVIAHITPGFAANLLTAMDTETAGRVFDYLHPDHQTLLLRQLPDEQRERLLLGIDPDVAASIRRRLPYPDGTAGALMEAPLASVAEDLTVREALRHLKRIRHGVKFYLYATEHGGVLTGVLSLHQLLNALPTTRVSEIMDPHVVTLSPTMSLRSVLDSPYWQEFHALPVTDANKLLLGVIRQKHTRRFAEQLAQSDLVANGLDTALAVGELFSTTAIELLSALISAGKPLTERDPHG